MRIRENDQMLIRCCDTGEEKKLLDAASELGLSVDTGTSGMESRKRAYYLNTFVYLLDPEAKTLGYIGQRSIFGAMAACETRSFSVDEALNIIRNGMAPGESAAPVFHIPHDGWKFPEELMASVCVPRDTFQFYHEKMRDRYAALLIPPCYRTRVQSVEFEISRLLCDVERLEDPREPMKKYGMGICYENAFDGTRINSITEEEKNEAMEYYKEHHRRMNRICDEYRRFLLFDLHSYSDDIIPPDLLTPGHNTPDLCIGTDPALTPPWLAESVRKHFEEAGFSTAFNYPYGGCYIPEDILTGRSSSACMPVMIEFNRRVYIKGKGVPDEEKVLAIRRVIRDIAAECAVRQ